MDRFRMDDPDAAEKASQLYEERRGYALTPNATVRAMQAVLDAIVQPHLPYRDVHCGAHLTYIDGCDRCLDKANALPRLPTRSQVEQRERQLEDACLILSAELPMAETKRLRREAPALADFLAHLHHAVEHEQAMVRVNVWATEDPEPEVDPAQVEADEVTDTLRAAAQYLMGRGPAPDIDALVPELRDMVDELLPAIVELVGDRIVPAEPEVDPAHVETLSALLLEEYDMPCAAGDFLARKLLASGRVQVTPQ